MGDSSRAVKVAYFVGGHNNFTGSQRSLAVLINALSREEVDPLALFAGRGRATDEFEVQGIPNKVIKSGTVFSTFGGVLHGEGRVRRAMAVGAGLPLLTLRLAKTLMDEDVDVVQANDFRALFICGWAARILRVPVVWHVRGDMSWFVGSRYMDIAQMLATEAVTVARSLEGSVPRDIPVRTIYDGMEPMSGSVKPSSEVATLVGGAGFAAPTLKLITASSFTPFKGLHHAVEALALAFQARPELRQRVCLIMLGDTTTTATSEYAEELLYRAQKRGVSENVVLAGWQRNPLEWIAASDMLVLPTTDEEHFVFRTGKEVDTVCTEGLPRVILDAYRVGTPVIASDVAGVEEMLSPGREGFIVRAGDPNEIAGAVRNVADNTSLLQELSVNALGAAEEYSAERMAGEFESLYRGLVG